MAEESKISVRQIWIGLALAALGAALFSTKGVFIKLAYGTEGITSESIDPISLIMLRMGLAFPVYLIIGLQAYAQRKKRGDLPSLMLVMQAFAAGIMGYYICSWLNFTGMQYVTAQLERLLLFTYPAFVFIFGVLFFRERMSWTGFGAILLAYSGIVLIFLRGNIIVGENVPLGSALIIVCAALFALFQLVAKPLIASMGPRLFTCIAMIGSTAAITIHFLTHHSLAGELTTALVYPKEIWMIAGGIAFFATILPSFFVNFAIEKIGPQAVAVIGMIGPLVTISLATNILNEPFGWVDAAGTALTVCGIGIYTWLDKKKAK